MTPPAAPRPPRSSGRRTTPTMRNVTVGPWSSTVSSAFSMSAWENDPNRRRSPTPTCSSVARPSPMVSSSTASGSAARPSITRARSTTLPNRSSTCAALGRNWLVNGPVRETRVSCRSSATAATPGTRRNCSICSGVTKPASISMLADRLVASKRESADSVRRAPATSASTTAPENATNRVSTTTLRQRRRRSARASISAAPITHSSTRSASGVGAPTTARTRWTPPRRRPPRLRSRCGRRACARCGRLRPPPRRRA